MEQWETKLGKIRGERSGGSRLRKKGQREGFVKAEMGQCTQPQTPFFMISHGICSTAGSLPRFWRRQRARVERGQEQLFLLLS